MGNLTEREREIMRLLSEGTSVQGIGKHFKVSDTSISRSISNIRTKILDLEDDIEFLVAIGFLKIREGELHFLSRSRDPKALTGLSKKR